MIVHINGYPGVGKLTVGKLLSAQLGGRLLDKRNRDGELVSTVYEHGDKEALLCSVVTWVKGEPLEQHTTETVQQVGRIAARLHTHATTWKRSADFRRPQYDAKGFGEAFRALQAPAAQRQLAPQEAEVSPFGHF